MSDNVLKKEFKQSDVQRVRNIVNKNYTAKTKLQSGYSKKTNKHKEGDVWQESGKTWTIKNGIKQNITKLDAAKKLTQLPLACPKCKNRMKKRLDKKMYFIHGFCFDCTILYEDSLKTAGLYEEYEKKMVSGNIEGFIVDMENWVRESLEDRITMVTEQGDKEDWGSLSTDYKEKILSDMNQYIKHLREHVI
jgi:hypothetical protein